ncbi:contactin-associated protein-like 2 [Acomys russatus]|uniref:contactin-associated protein-like 2 n=1 Tax=Acomys russatus TaxID=60746 RepID=UPI0021E2D440|nr:contactin-associated protein-like 2 [Acomys russatus]
MSLATDLWHLDHLDSGGANFLYNPEQGKAIGNGVNRASAVIGEVTVLYTLVFLIWYMFYCKGTYHTNKAEGAESAESTDAATMNSDSQLHRGH